MKRRISLILLVLILFFLSCGKGKHETVTHFEEVMETLKRGDTTKAAVSEDLKINPDAIRIYSEAYRKMTYRINRTEVKDNRAALNVTIKTPELKELVTEYIKKVTESSGRFQGKSESEIKNEQERIMKELVKGKLEGGDLKYMERTFDVLYEKTGDRWQMSPEGNKDYIEMITFGMLEFK